MSLSSSWFDNIEISARAGRARAKDLSKTLGIKNPRLWPSRQPERRGHAQIRRRAVAMENAVEPLKAVARHIAPHHEESGVGRALRALVLGGEGA